MCYGFCKILQQIKGLKSGNWEKEKRTSADPLKVGGMSSLEGDFFL